MNNKDKDAGSSIKNVEDDRREGEGFLASAKMTAKEERYSLLVH